MARILFFTCVVFSVIMFSKAARILAVFPTPSISHQIVFRPLTQELVKRGQEVVIVTTDPAFRKGQTPSNLTEIDLHDISYGSWHKFVQKFIDAMHDVSQLKVAADVLYDIFEHQINSEGFQSLLRNKEQKFNLLLLEEYAKPTLGLSCVYKAPIIQVSALGAIDSCNNMGAPMHELLYPVLLFATRRVNNLTFWEKINELYNKISVIKLAISFKNFENEIVKRMFGPDTPSSAHLAKNIVMLLLNIHSIWDGNRPVPPGIIYIGGLHKKPAMKLPQDLKNYLDSSKNGVIYISFGSIIPISLLPPKFIQMLISVLSRLPYDVLWKWEKDEMPRLSDNIRISKWLPQSDLLRHPKIKLFITHGGLLSTEEAIDAGVPLIGIPMLGDGWYHVEKYVYYRIGLRLDMESLTEGKLRNAIDIIMGDKSYRHNVIKLNTLMNDQPQRPLERAVWWTEHVLRHGGAGHLRTPAADMPWAEYLMLDVVIPVLLISTIFILFVSIALYYVSCYVLLRVHIKAKVI